MGRRSAAVGATRRGQPGDLVVAATTGERVIVRGERLAFGRSGTPGVALALADDPRLHRRCGSVVAGDDDWSVVNEGRWLGLRIVGTDRVGVVHLAPGERFTVPWATARVEIPVGAGSHTFTVERVGSDEQFGEADGTATAAEVGAGDGAAVGDATVTPVRIDRSSGYFRALVALCEPRLLDPSSAVVATDLEIARRLNRSGREDRRVGGKAVERRLDLCRTRFGLKDGGDGNGGAGLERRDARRVLVEVALLTATVTPADLHLLDPDPARAR